MSKMIALKGKVISVTRKYGKTAAVVQIEIPADKSNEIPLKEVNVTIEESQQSMFPETTVTSKKTPVRGNKG